MATTPPQEGLSPILKDLQADLLVGFIDDSLDFAQRRFRMHTLSDGELVWAHQYMTTASSMSLLSSRKSAVLAVAISHITPTGMLESGSPEIPVEELFQLPGDPKLVEFLQNSPEERKGYFREKLYAFLSTLPDPMITELHTFYEKLAERREEVIKNLKKSSKETPSSHVSNTSSPADGLPAEEQKETHGSSFGG